MQGTAVEKVSGVGREQGAQQRAHSTNRGGVLLGDVLSACVGVGVGVGVWGWVQDRNTLDQRGMGASVIPTPACPTCGPLPSQQN